MRTFGFVGLLSMQVVVTAVGSTVGVHGSGRQPRQVRPLVVETVRARGQRMGRVEHSFSQTVI